MHPESHFLLLPFPLLYSALYCLIPPISKVFGKKSNIKLVSETAAYDELELEKLLYSMCGDELLLDSNRYDCSRVFCLSTKVIEIKDQSECVCVCVCIYMALLLIPFTRPILFYTPITTTTTAFVSVSRLGLSTYPLPS
jgi:hypothetical protein